MIASPFERACSGACGTRWRLHAEEGTTAAAAQPPPNAAGRLCGRAPRQAGRSHLPRPQRQYPDRSTPADLARVDIFAWTAPSAVSADDVVRRGTRIGTVAVNQPPDPDEPEPETPAPKGDGVDQNATARFRAKRFLPTRMNRPTAHTWSSASARAAVRGVLSNRIAVPLVAPPPAPGQPLVSYDEKAVTVSWTPVDGGGASPFAYSVYPAESECSGADALPN